MQVTTGRQPPAPAKRAAETAQQNTAPDSPAHQSADTRWHASNADHGTDAAPGFLTEPGRVWLLCCSGLVGVVGGAASAAYLGALSLAAKWLWPDRSGIVVHSGILLATGVAISVLLWLLGDPGDTGLLLDSVHRTGGPPTVRPLTSLVPVSLLSIAAGGGIGPEPPLMQTTATLASWIGRRTRTAANGLTVLTATGMAAGFAVLLAAPLGASVFALEILHRKGLEYYEALLPACVGSLSSYGLFALVTGRGLSPLWPIPRDSAPMHLTDLLLGLGAGAASAVVCHAFNALLRAARRLAARVPPALQPPAAGAALALLGIAVPTGLTYGDIQLGQLVRDTSLTAALLALTALGHMLSAVLALAGRWRGGVIIPMFLIGYCLGRAALIQCGHSAGAMTFALCMMVACNAGITKTPLGSALVIAQAAGIAQLPAMTLAALTCLALTTKINFLSHQRSRSRFPPPTPPASTAQT